MIGRPLLLLILSLATAPAGAGEPEIVAVETEAQVDIWRFSVTLRHDDTGWDHYADAWQVIGPDGEILGTRTLAHPHVAEQPFTRALTGIAIPPDTTVVTLRAHDVVHGWSEPVAVRLSRP